MLIHLFSRSITLANFQSSSPNRASTKSPGLSCSKNSFYMFSWLCIKVLSLTFLYIFIRMYFYDKKIIIYIFSWILMTKSILKNKNIDNPRLKFRN